LTPTLSGGIPWYEGKQAIALLCALEASDAGGRRHPPVGRYGPMLFRSAHVEQGALRLFVSRTKAQLQTLANLRDRHAAEQLAHGLGVTAHDNWLVVQPREMGKVSAPGPWL
jgi:hypothetical protein